MNKEYKTKEFGNAKNEKGKAAENKSKEYLEQSFLKDFIFFNPKFKSGLSEKELADLIVVYFDTAIIIQCKSKEYTNNIRKYIRKTVKEACNQLKSGFNRLTNFQLGIELYNERRGKIKWDYSKIKKIHTLIILEQNFPIVDYNLAVIIDPEIGSLKFSPQIFDLNDLKYLLRLIDTPPDFLNYLNEREKIVMNPAYKMHSEKELFGFYMSNNRKISIFEEQPKATTVIFDGSFSKAIDEGTLGKQLRNKIELDKVSYFIDKILNEMHTTKSPEYLKVMEELVKLNRFERRTVGKAALEKAFEVAQRKTKTGYRCIILNSKKEIGFVFLFSDLQREVSKELLKNVTYSIKYKKRLQKVIGISMPVPFLGISYIDFLYDDRNYFYPNKKIKELADEIFGKEKIIDESEFPT